MPLAITGQRSVFTVSAFWQDVLETQTSEFLCRSQKFWFLALPTLVLEVIDTIIRSHGFSFLLLTHLLLDGHTIDYLFPSWRTFRLFPALGGYKCFCVNIKFGFS